MAARLSAELVATAGYGANNTPPRAGPFEPISSQRIGKPQSALPPTTRWLSGIVRAVIALLVLVACLFCFWCECHPSLQNEHWARNEPRSQEHFWNVRQKLTHGNLQSWH